MTVRTYVGILGLLALPLAAMAGGCSSDETTEEGAAGSAGTSAAGSAGAAGKSGGGGTAGSGGSTAGSGGSTAGSGGSTAGAGGSTAGAGGSTAGAGGSTAGAGGEAGAAGAAGEGGAAGGAGGPTCPPTTFEPLTACNSPTPSPSAQCFCADKGTDTDCATKWDDCAADEGCSKAVYCFGQGCDLNTCAALAGAGLPKAVALQGCQPLLAQCMGAGGAAGAAGAGGAGGEAGAAGAAGGAGEGGAAGAGGEAGAAGASGAAGGGGSSAGAVPDSFYFTAMGFDPHIGSRFELVVSKKDGGDVVGHVVIPKLNNGSIYLGLPGSLSSGVTYNVDYFVDANANGKCDAPGGTGDHVWHREVTGNADPMKTTTLDVTHDTTWTDVCTSFDKSPAGTDITFKLDQFSPHTDNNIYVAVVNKGTNKWVAWEALNPLSTPTFEVTFKGIAQAGQSYEIVYFADMDNSGDCNAPPADHVWLKDVPADGVLTVTHDTNWTDACSLYN